MNEDRLDGIGSDSYDDVKPAFASCLPFHRGDAAGVHLRGQNNLSSLSGRTLHHRWPGALNASRQEF